MQILEVTGVGSDYAYTWPRGNIEVYQQWIDYLVTFPEGEQTARIGFGTRRTYSRDRKRVVVWIGRSPQVEFLGADDYENSGDVLSEIKLAGTPGERICRFPEDSVPERYAHLAVEGLPNRVTGHGVHNALAVVANVADHRTLVALAALRMAERQRH